MSPRIELPERDRALALRNILLLVSVSVIPLKVGPSLLSTVRMSFWPDAFKQRVFSIHPEDISRSRFL